MKKIIITVSLLLINAVIVSIEEISTLGPSGYFHINQEICDALATAELCRILNPENAMALTSKKEAKTLAQQHGINADYPLSLAQLKQARANAESALAPLESYNNAQPHSYDSSVAYFKKAIRAYDQAIFDLEKAPQTCTAFFTYSIHRIKSAIQTKIAQSDLINKAPERIIKRLEGVRYEDVIKRALKHLHAHNESDLRMLVCHFNQDIN